MSAKLPFDIRATTHYGIYEQYISSLFTFMLTLIYSDWEATYAALIPSNNQAYSSPFQQISAIYHFREKQPAEVLTIQMTTESKKRLVLQGVAASLPGLTLGNIFRMGKASANSIFKAAAGDTNVSFNIHNTPPGTNKDNLQERLMRPPMDVIRSYKTDDLRQHVRMAVMLLTKSAQDLRTPGSIAS